MKRRKAIISAIVVFALALSLVLPAAGCRKKAQTYISVDCESTINVDYGD